MAVVKGWVQGNVGKFGRHIIGRTEANHLTVPNHPTDGAVTQIGLLDIGHKFLLVQIVLRYPAQDCIAPHHGKGRVLIQLRQGQTVCLLSRQLIGMFRQGMCPADHQIHFHLAARGIEQSGIFVFKGAQPQADLADRHQPLDLRRAVAEIADRNLRVVLPDLLGTLGSKGQQIVAMNTKAQSSLGGSCRFQRYIQFPP